MRGFPFHRPSVGLVSRRMVVEIYRRLGEFFPQFVGQLSVKGIRFDYTPRPLGATVLALCVWCGEVDLNLHLSFDPLLMLSSSLSDSIILTDT